MNHSPQRMIHYALGRSRPAFTSFASSPEAEGQARHERGAAPRRTTALRAYGAGSMRQAPLTVPTHTSA